MATIRNIIFDFDGTLADTAPLIVKVMQVTIREMKLPARSDEECQATIGLRLEDVPEMLWPGEGVPSSGFASTYRRNFNELKRPFDVSCFPGVEETLKHLHDSGMRMAIASSRSHASLEEYVEQFAMEDYFAMRVGGNDVTHGKPAPDPVVKILSTCGWNAEETLTVGDAPVDILMGHAANTRTCAVSYGNSSPAQLLAAHPSAIIDSFSDLIQVVD